jgi:hypothetical protein
MRKFLYSVHFCLLFVLVTTTLPSILQAQLCVNTQQGGQTGCNRSSTTTTVEIAPTGGTTAVSVSPYSPGTYFRIPVLAGGCYTIGTCGAPFDMQINCYQGLATTGPFAYDDDSGPLCGGLQASCSMVPTFTDYARIDVRQYSCLPGGSSSITVTVQQNNNLTITSSPASLCQGQTRTLTATPVPVTGAQPNSGSSGAFTGTGVSGNTFTAPVPAGNSQNYTVTYSFGYVSTTQQITVFHAPSTAAAGSNQTVCAGTTTLAANAPAFGTGAWTVVSGTGSVTNPTSPTSAVTGLTPGQSTALLWTITNGPCSATFDTVVIFRDVNPTVANAGADQSVCIDNITLAGNAVGVGVGNWTRITGAGTVVNPNDPNSAVTGLGVGSNTFVWTIANGVCLSTADSVTFTRDAEAPNALAGPDKLICESFTTLTGNIPAYGQGVWTILSGSGVVTTPNSPNSPITAINPGTTVLTWTISNGTCPPKSDTMEITRSALPNPPTVTGNQAVCFGETVTLTASSSATNPSYIWWDAPAGGNAIAGGATYNSPPLTGPLVVYLEVTDGTTQCPSTRTQYNVNVNPLPVISLGSDTTFCESDSICLDAGASMSSYQWNNGFTSRVLCTNQSGLFWVEVLDGNGCFGTDTIQLTAIPSPVVSLGPDLTLCNGNSSTISVPSVPGESYSWSTGDTTNSISVSSNGTYSVTVTNGIGCSTSDDLVVTALVTPTAGFSIDTSNCPQITFNDNSTSAVNWSWSFGDGSNSTATSPAYSYQASGNGTYTVTLVVNGPCGADTTTQSITIDCVVGISIPSNLSITVYPNPNDGMFKVHFDGLEENAFLTIFNELGQQVYASQIEGCSGACDELVNLQGVAAGVYLTKIKVGDAVVSKRVMIR